MAMPLREFGVEPQFVVVGAGFCRPSAKMAIDLDFAFVSFTAP
jgi:hypothetical protein